MEMFFSDFAANLGGPKNPLYALHERLKTEGANVVDLVRGNVNEHGIIYPPETLAGILKDAATRPAFTGLIRSASARRARQSRGTVPI